MRLLRRGRALAFLLIAAAGSASAEEAQPSPPPEESFGEEALFRLDAILKAQVVTASGAEEDRALAPANVFVISREDIEIHGYRSIAEALAQTPGLYLIDDLVIPSVGVRGVSGGLRAGTRIIRVMINGQLVSFRPDLTAFIGMEFIPMEAVERIEIAKGPLSALYGPNAFLATINVITREAAPGTSVEAGGHVWIIRDKVGGGGSAMVSYRHGLQRFLAAFSGDWVSRSGLNIQKTFPGQDPSSPIYQGFFGVSSVRDVARPMSGFAQLHLESERLGTLEISAGIQELDSIGEFQVSSVLTHRSRIALQNVWTSARYEKVWNKKFSAGATIGYSRGDVMRDYNLSLTGSNSSVFQPKFGYWAVNGAVDATYSPIPQLDIKLQVDFDYDDEKVLYYQQTYTEQSATHRPGDTVNLISPTEPTERPIYDVGAGLQVSSGRFARLPGLRLTANVRIDRISYGVAQFPAEYSWRAVVAYRWNANVVAKLIGGHAFQTPSGVLMFAHPGFGNSYNIVGNFTAHGGSQTLSPQEIDSVEAVVSGRIGKWVTLEGGTFYQHIDNTIAFDGVNANYVPINHGVQQQLGFELSAHMALAWFTPYVTANLLLTEANGTLTIDPQPLYPSYFGYVGTDVDLPAAHLRINGQVRWVGPRGSSQANTLLNNLTPYTLPGYADIDLTISTINLHLIRSSETRFMFSARNLIGLPRSEPGFGGFDIPNIGRTFFVDVRQLF
jgi:outer membrane receptor protein involved in Fe transport